MINTLRYFKRNAFKHSSACPMSAIMCYTAVCSYYSVAFNDTELNWTNRNMLKYIMCTCSVTIFIFMFAIQNICTVATYLYSVSYCYEMSEGMLVCL